LILAGGPWKSYRPFAKQGRASNAYVAFGQYQEDEGVEIYRGGAKLARRIERFVCDYGLPRVGGELGLLSVRGFMQDASELYQAKRLAAALNQAENGEFQELRKLKWHLHQDLRLVPAGAALPPTDSGPYLLLAGQEAIMPQIVGHLKGIQPNLAVQGLKDFLAAWKPPTRLVATWTCPDLLSAMWLELYLDAVKGNLHPRCKGCGIPYGADHGRQEYCSPACQKAAEMRRYRHRRAAV
jgi:hypothetical protein